METRIYTKEITRCADCPANDTLMVKPRGRTKQCLSPYIDKIPQYHCLIMNKPNWRFQDTIPKWCRLKKKSEVKNES